MKKTTKEFIFENKEIIQKYLDFDYPATKIYRIFVDDPNLETPNFTIRNFQQYLKKLSTNFNQNLAIEHKEKETSFKNERAQEKKLTTFDFDAEKINLEDIE